MRIRIAALVLAAVAASYIEGPGQDWTALVLGRGLDASPGLAASGPLAFSGGLLLARLLLDAVTARISKTFISMASAAIVTLSMVVAFVTTLDGTGSGLALVAIGLAGFGAGPIYPMLFNAAEMLSTHYGVAPSTTAAVISTCSRVGAISAPVAVGALAGSSGLFTVFIIMAAGGLVLLVSLPTALR